MSTNNRVQGFRTSASYVTGGVTSSQTFNRHGALRRGSTPGLGGGEGDPPGDPDCPNCIWVDDVCIICFPCIIKTGFCKTFIECINIYNHYFNI